MSKSQAKRVNIVSLKLVKESSVLYSNRQINSPENAADILKPFLEEEDREKFIILCLDTKNQPTSIHVVSIGSLNSSLVHPREVFKAAILSNSNSVILGHGHPSGLPTPSREDIDVTKRLIEAGKIIGIEVIDHIIIGHSEYISLKEKGII